MKAKPAHIVIDGEPLCVNHLYLRHVIDEDNVTCDYTSQRRAHKLAKLVRKHVGSKRVQVKLGPCPTLTRK